MTAGGVYHSRYDTFEHHSRFVDPGFVYDALLAKTAGRMVLRVADAELPVQRAGDFADAVAEYLDEVKKLADDKREEAEAQAALLRDRAFQLAADPTKSSGLPDGAGAACRISSSRRSKTRSIGSSAAPRLMTMRSPGNARSATAGAARSLAGADVDIDQTLAPDVGLPGRPWYKNLIYAPGRFTGYGAKTLPGVREAIEDRRWADADRYVKLTADALNAYSDRLDQATALLKGK